MHSGYSCKNLSHLSQQPTNNVLPSGVGSSGKTCAAMLEFVRRYRPRCGILENVDEMAKSEEVSKNVAFLNQERHPGPSYSAPPAQPSILVHSICPSVRLPSHPANPCHRRWHLISRQFYHAFGFVLRIRRPIVD